MSLGRKPGYHPTVSGVDKKKTNKQPMTSTRFSINDRTVFRVMISLVIGSVILVSPAAAQGSGGLCNTQLNSIFNAVMQLALYGGFALAILSYVGTSAMMGLPGVSQGQEQNLKEVQSSAIRNGAKIIAVPLAVAGLNQVVSLPVANCLTLVPF